jgi:hypothetical protein
METGAPRRRYHALDGSGGTRTAPVECALDTISGSSPPSLKPTPRPGRVCFAIGKLTLQSSPRTEARLLWNHVAGSVFQGRYVYCASTGLHHHTYGERAWDCPGNKVRFQREQSAGFSCPNRCPKDCCTSSRCAGACACASGESGSPIVSMSSCSSNQAAIR